LSITQITSTPIVILPTTLVRLGRQEVIHLMEALAELEHPNPFAGNTTLDHTTDETFWLDFTAIAKQEPAVARTLWHCLKVEGCRLTLNELVGEVLEFFEGTVWIAQEYAVIVATATLVYAVLRRYRTPLVMQYQLPQMSYEQVPLVGSKASHISRWL
jgi:hypothetical protein